MGFKQEKWSLHRIYARTRGVFMALKWLRLWEWCQFNVMMILDILDDVQIIFSKITFFPTCQVRVVRFYVSCLLLLSSPPPPAQPRSTLSVPCRTSTTTIHAQCALPDLNHDHPRPVFSVGPQPRPSTPSVPCRTSTTTIPAQCSLPDLNHDHPRPVFPAGPQPRVSTPSVPCRTSCRKIWDKECAEES